MSEPDNVLSIDTLRHSTAHILAAAVLQLWPTAKFGVGPAIENGFYYDVDVAEPISIKELEQIEQRMRQIVKSGTQFERLDVSVHDAVDTMRDLHQPYKLDLLELLRTRGSTAILKESGDSSVADSFQGVDEVSLYRVGGFLDLCRGPHVKDVGVIRYFKLTSIAGAYWRGDVNRPQLQRIYGTAFSSKEELAHHLWQVEEAKKRDHRKLGPELGIFRFSDEVGSGLPIWLPNGTVLRDEIEFLARQEERKDGYQRVVTPMLAKGHLYERSGHLPYYKDEMYPPIKIDKIDFYLRPMNCPHHHQVFLAHPRSYRELPVRVTEYANAFRYEASGALSGLMRVRSFCQNDAHIYCSVDQAQSEFVRVMQLHSRYYKLFCIEKFYMRLSLPDLNDLEKYVDQPDDWLAALTIIRAAMDESGLPYVEKEGEAAFYGPKVDFMIRSAVGQEYAISTNQLDFLAASRFDLTYTAPDGTQQPVYVIHRAPLGSHERFVAFLLEHYGGAFPTWLAPVQARIIPIADRHVGYAEQVRTKLGEVDVHNSTGGLRLDVDASVERMQKKVRNAQLMKIPYMLVVGDEEVADGSVAVRLRSGEDLGRMEIDQLAARMRTECETRRDV